MSVSALSSRHHAWVGALAQMAASDGTQDLAFALVAALAPRLRAREISPVDLVEACLARIEAVAPRLGCFATIVPERARADARAAAAELTAGRWRGPLHGIPFGLVDAVDTRAIPTGLGLGALAARTPERDGVVAARLADHGAVLVGKLHVFPPAGGPPDGGAPAAATRSPWNPALPAGAPSPGPAAAVAAGLVPFAIAAHGAEADTAAGVCGVTALRPTYGVLPRSGAVLGSFTLASLGPVARSAEDCALVLDALAGADPRDPSSVGAPPGIRRIAAELPKGLRVGIIELPAPGSEARGAWSGMQEALRAAGAILAPASLPELPWAALAALLAGAEASVLREDVLGVAAVGARPAAGASAADYVRAARLRGEAQRALARLLQRHDLLLAPAPRASSAADPAPADALAAAVALGGLPALTLPIGLEGGRPVAARLVAPPLEEARLLGAAATFQARSSHHLHRPPLAPASAGIAALTGR